MRSVQMFFGVCLVSVVCRAEQASNIAWLVMSTYSNIVEFTEELLPEGHSNKDSFVRVGTKDFYLTKEEKVEIRNALNLLDSDLKTLEGVQKGYRRIKGSGAGSGKETVLLGYISRLDIFKLRVEAMPEFLKEVAKEVSGYNGTHPKFRNMSHPQASVLKVGGRLAGAALAVLGPVFSFLTIQSVF